MQVVITKNVVYHKVVGALTDQILEGLKNIPYCSYKNIYGYVPKEAMRNSVHVAVRRLEKRGFIQKDLNEGVLCVKLTSLGNEYLEKMNQKNLEKSILDISLKNKVWDGNWRIVVFDIPEKSRRVRQALRMGLKMLEFNQLQKSVWISKVDCTQELRDYIQQLNLEEYVLIFESKDIGKNVL